MERAAVLRPRPGPRWGRSESWSAKQWDLFYSLLEQGYSDGELAIYLRIPVGQARWARESRGWQVGPALGGYMTLRAVALRMGYYGTSGTPRRWVREGRLRAVVRRWEGRPNATVLVKDGWLMDFLEDAQQLHQWEWERIADPWLREWARRRREGAVLTTREAAREIGVEHATLRTWASWFPELPVMREGVRGRMYWPRDLVAELADKYEYGVGIRGMVAEMAG